MTIAPDMQILQGLVGGVLIGLSALLLLAGTGKIAGISGIAGNLIAKPRQSAWRGLFVIGLLSGASVFLLVNGSLNVAFPSFDARTAIGAALVGIGTRLGSGCTSGHGVCGIGRLSVRSMTATAVFMVVAILTVTIVGR